ncbi:MAG: two-component regulator propeller domain-containing protein, partial [Rhodothermales bacterium]
MIFAFALATANAQQPDLFDREIPEASQGRAVSLRFESLGIENGLSQSTIYDMLQDRHGFMWFGTQDGLNRFDGYDVKVYRHEPFDSTSWLEGWATALTEDDEGRLWVGSWSSVSVMDPVTEKFTHYRHDDADSTSITDESPRRMIVDSEGYLWIATTGGGLDRMNLKEPGEFVHYRYDEADSTSINHDVVFDVFQSSDGTIWAGTRNGLAKLTRQGSEVPNGRFVRYLFRPLPDGDPGRNGVIAIYERPEEPGILWLATSRGLVRFDSRDGSFQRFALDPNDPGGTIAADVAPDPTNRGILWVTINQKGLARFDLRTQRFFLYQADPNDPHGLPDNQLIGLLTDRSGVIWVKAERTVERFNPATVGFEFVRSDPD